MKSLPHDRIRQTWRRFAAVALVLTLGAAASVTVTMSACNDGPGAPVAPGNTIVNDTMEDAVAHPSQDATVGDVYAPQGTSDAAYPDGSLDGSANGSTGYEDVQSPMNACAACACGKTVGYCLENGTTNRVTGLPEAGKCALADAAAPAVGCNPLPADCLAHPTCACILNGVQPPLGCYPECTNSGAYFDVFCNNP
jgi:hypothetical protein